MQCVSELRELPDRADGPDRSGEPERRSGTEAVPPERGEDWVALTASTLSMGSVASWVERPDCGAVVIFAGTVRDHAEGRPGVVELEYEAYERQVEPRLRRIADEARLRWPAVGRLALLHRAGTLSVGECSVIVAVSAGHRSEAFESARYCIDTVKTSVPIWKREKWAGGEDWGVDAHDLTEIGP